MSADTLQTAQRSVDGGSVMNKRASRGVPAGAEIERSVRELFPEARSIAVVSERVSKGVRLQRLVMQSDKVRAGLIAKHYFGAIEPAQFDRPRLGLRDDRQMKPPLEYKALVGLHGLDYQGLARVRPVCPLSYDAGHRLLIMEEFPGRSARELIMARSGQALSMFRAGGSALAHAHGLQSEGIALRTTSALVDEQFFELLDFVATQRKRRVHQGLEHWWSKQPVEDLVMGTAHGDCSARNLLVSEAGDVAWVDGLFRYATPVYEDLATFTTSTRTTLRLVGKGWMPRNARRLASDAFLDGYCDVRPDLNLDQLARFEVLVLLDRQASLLSAPRTVRNRILLTLTDREISAARQKSS